jgi:3-deoxy-manno-octulosonate cytidylyltransferase (CMP-KDO synthetase)
LEQKTAMKYLGLIPARYESSRFPGKPLVMIKEKPMIQWVYEKAAPTVDYLYVATDDQRIEEAVNNFGGNVILTSDKHRSGTDRCAEAAEKLEKIFDFDIVINIQGDEPFIQSQQIESLKSCFGENTDIATLIKKVENTTELFNPNKPKVVCDNRNYALYFSRSPIPYYRNEQEENWLKRIYWAHIGIYGFRKNILREVTKLSPGDLEITESLEQLRWLENGYKIKTAETFSQGFGIDTPEDLATALQLLEKNLVS